MLELHEPLDDTVIGWDVLEVELVVEQSAS